MNIHEQIIAFLDGELHDESQVAELLHVLAVAPEKQRLLIDQVKMRRSYATFGGTLASPVAADLAILQGLHAIDAGFPSATAPPPEISPSGARFFRYHPMLMSSAAALILVIGGVIGYLLGGGETRREASVENARLRAPSAASTLGPASFEASRDLVRGLRDSLSLLRSRYGALLASATPSTAHRASSRAVASSDAAGRGWMTSNDHVADGVGMPPSVPSAVNTPVALRSVPADVERSRPHDAASSRSPKEMDGPSVTEHDLSVADRVWQIGLRSNFRLSFPRVYGIEPSTNAMTDREVVATRRFEKGDLGLAMPVRFGAAVGGTQFSESFRGTDNSGRTPGTIEQTPSFIYGRGFIAPEIISAENWGGSLELGGGGTSVGPFVTFGLGMEYRAMDRVSVDVGLSSWLLWTKLEDQSIMSTNLNAHVGAAMWFSFDEIFQ